MSFHTRVFLGLQEIELREKAKVVVDIVCLRLNPSVVSIAWIVHVALQKRREVMLGSSSHGSCSFRAHRSTNLVDWFASPQSRGDLIAQVGEKIWVTRPKDVNLPVDSKCFGEDWESRLLWIRKRSCDGPLFIRSSLDRHDLQHGLPVAIHDRALGVSLPSRHDLVDSPIRPYAEISKCRGSSR